jgi:lysine/ornithine N-monooxygenase
MIIGAGPYGISLAYDLWERGISFKIAGNPFELWLSHTLNSSSIRSDRHASEIFTRNKTFDLTAFIKEAYPHNATFILKQRLPNHLFRSYLTNVLKNLPFEIYNQKVTKLTKEKNLFQITIENGQTFEAEQVVLATGIGQHKKLPKILEKLPKDLVAHSWDVNTYANWKDKRLLVIGGGQSAAESVEHLYRNNDITWLMRRPPLFYSEPINLPKPIFKLILYLSPYFYYIPPKFKKRFAKKFVETTVTPDMKHLLKEKKVTLHYEDAGQLGLIEHTGKLYSNTLKQQFDGIVAATGYHYHLQHLSFIDDHLLQKVKAEKEIPKVNFNFETNVKGLFIVGGMAEPTYGPAQRFMIGMRHATLRLGKFFNEG